MMRHFLLIGLCGAAICGVSPLKAQEPQSGGVKLREGDQVEIRIGGVPQEEISQISASYTVVEGNVNMPYIGKIHAGGSDPAQLQQAIENAYRSQQIYTNPSITVLVPSAARFVNIGGAVRAPQRVAFTPDLTILGVINAAGGFTEFADQSKIRLMRDGKATMINIKEVRKNPALDVRLKPGDNIEVQQSFW